MVSWRDGDPGVGSSILKNALWCFSEEGVYGALVTREMRHTTHPPAQLKEPVWARHGPPGAPSHDWWGRMLAKLVYDITPRTF